MALGDPRAPNQVSRKRVHQVLVEQQVGEQLLVLVPQEAETRVRGLRQPDQGRCSEWSREREHQVGVGKDPILSVLGGATAFHSKSTIDI